MGPPPILAAASAVGDTLVALGGAFLVAGLLARLGRRAGFPTIPLFMAAGVLMGPHTPGFVLVDDPAELEVFAAVGLVMLLFHLGLEFSLGDLLAGGKKLAASGVAYLLLNVGGGIALGAALGAVLGWGAREALIIGGIVGISSSAIVTKLLGELKRLANPETPLILGIIVVEDVFLALYLALLQPALGGTAGMEAVVAVAKAFSFLVVLASVARWGGRWAGKLVETRDDELLTVCFVGFALLVAGVAAQLGVSDAIGAFLAGMILAESSVAHRVERLVLPLRDAFAAVFFFAFGLTVDPGELGSVAAPVAIAVAFTLLANLAAGIVAARINDMPSPAGSMIGLTVLARGEFSLILASLAVAAGLDDRIAAFAATYVLVLAVAGPLLAARAPALAARFGRGARGADPPEKVVIPG